LGPQNNAWASEGEGAGGRGRGSRPAQWFLFDVFGVNSIKNFPSMEKSLQSLWFKCVKKLNRCVEYVNNIGMTDLNELTIKVSNSN
jgi:hypothetical protein